MEFWMKIKIVEQRKRIVIDTTIELEPGFNWGAQDLLETLEAVDNVDVVVERKLGSKLVDLEILEYAGNSRWYSPAIKGPNFDDVLSQLREILQFAAGTADQYNKDMY